MGIILDLVVIAIILLFTALGFKKGLTGSLIKLLSFVIALVLAFMLYKPVANLVMKNTQIDENIETTIINTLSKEETTNEENTSTTLLEDINNQIENATTEARNEIVATTAKDVTKTIINFASGIVIFIVARLALILARGILKGITSLPILKQLDKAGGILYGLIEGLAIVYIILAIVSLTSLMWGNNSFVEAISKSTITEILYSNNLLLKILF